MPSLKEIKGRIGSVKSTLKITSAMKLVASAKLRKAQQAIEGMRPYERNLQGMLARLMATVDGAGVTSSGAFARIEPPQKSEIFWDPGKSRSDAEEDVTSAPTTVAVVAFASNSSLCGAFNANAVRLTMDVVKSYAGAGVTVYSIGRKMAEAMKKFGYPSPADYQKMADAPSYDAAAALAEQLMADYREGRLDRVELVYNHFVSSGKQVPVRETLLPMTPSRMAGQAGHDEAPAAGGTSSVPGKASPLPGDAPVIPGQDASVIPGLTGDPDYILEPSASALLEELLPKSLKLKFFTALLDSNASEHAARTVAMQTATDNGEDLLQELTLQYNKSRQQKITSEILDLAGGSQE